MNMRCIAALLAVLTGAGTAGARDRVADVVTTTVDPDDGTVSVKVGDLVICRRDMLQVVDQRNGWRVLYPDVRRATMTRHDDGTMLAARRVRGVLTMVKAVSPRANGLRWGVTWTCAANPEARRCYYTVEIPEDTFGEALATLHTDAGVRAGLLSELGNSGEDPVKRLDLLVRGLAVSLDLAGRGVTWQLQDWTDTEHRSYRLRIEKKLDGLEWKAGAEVAVDVETRPPAAYDEALREFRQRRTSELAARRRQAGYTAEGPLQIKSVTPSSQSVPRHGLIEWQLDLSAAYDNPFDPDDVSLDATITDPAGQALTVPGFFMHRFADGAPNAWHTALPKPVWCVRFAPRVVGEHSCTFTLRDRSGAATTGRRSFRCIPSDTACVIGAGGDRNAYLVTDRGDPYIPIGINLFGFMRLNEPPPRDRLDTLLGYIDSLADQGVNFIRLRMDSWWLAIEGPEDRPTGYSGPGWYHQGTCADIDAIYRRCAARDVRVMHCIDNANANVNGAAQAWRRPYNTFLKENGGPCETVDEFWTHPDATRLFRNRLRYTVARWGWNPTLMAWEFWNEVSAREATIEDAADWHRDMARWLRRTDPYDRLITTSLMGDHTLHDAIWSLPEMDILQLHTYARTDLVALQERLTRRHREHYQKPFYIGETGLAPTYRPGGFFFDGDGVHLHNGLWASLFSGGAGAAAFWYIESPVDRLGLWQQHRPLAEYVRSVPFLRPGLQAKRLENPAWTELPVKRHLLDWPLPTSHVYAFTKGPTAEFVLGPDGSVSPAGVLRPYLHCGEARRDPPTFLVDAPRSWTLVIGVRVSVGDESQRLRVSVDGEQVVDRPFPAGEGLGTGGEYIEPHDNWRTQVDETVTLTIPPGKHRILVDAVGKDRLEVDVLLRDYVEFEQCSPVQAFALTTPTTADIWFHNRLSNAVRIWYEQPVPSVPEGMQCCVPGLLDGPYTVSWFDTWNGTWQATERISSSNGELMLQLPRIDRDLACRIRRR